MTSGKSNLVTVAVELKHETEEGNSEKGAYLIFDGEKEVWIPKSQCELTAVEGKGTLFDLELSEWLAKDKGLI